MIDLAILQTSAILVLNRSSSKILETCLISQQVWGLSYETGQFSSFTENLKILSETTVYLKQHKVLFLMEQWFQPLGFMSIQSWEDVIWYHLNFRA